MRSITPRKINKIRIEQPADPRTPKQFAHAPSYPLMALSAYLRQFGYDCDYNVSENDADIFFLTATTPNYSETYRRALYILRQRKDVFVVIGGPHVTARPEDLPPFERIIGVIGEGEQTALELLDSIQTDTSIAEVKGLAYRYWDGGIKLGVTGEREEIADLSTLPPPDWLLFSDKATSVQLSTSRGCPYSCIFCATARWKTKLRQASADWVIQSVHHAMQCKPGLRNIEFVDDLFIFGRGRLRAIIDGIKNAGYSEMQADDTVLETPIHFHVTARANLFTYEIAEMLAELPALSVSFGFESGSERILKKLKPQAVAVSDNHRAWELCDLFDIPCNYSMIIGHPDETEADLIATTDFIKEHPGGVVDLYPLTPLPGTALWEQYGKVPDDWGTINMENTANHEIII